MCIFFCQITWCCWSDSFSWLCHLLFLLVIQCLVKSVIWSYWEGRHQRNIWDQVCLKNRHNLISTWKQVWALVCLPFLESWLILVCLAVIFKSSPSAAVLVCICVCLCRVVLDHQWYLMENWKADCIHNFCCTSHSLTLLQERNFDKKQLRLSRDTLVDVENRFLSLFIGFLKPHPLETIQSERSNCF